MFSKNYFSKILPKWTEGTRDKSLVAQSVKNLPAMQATPCSVEDLGSIPGLGRSPGGGNDNPHQYSCLETPHGKRRLAGYSPWGHKEWDMT